MSENILELHGISKTFPSVKALDQVDLSIRRGEIHALMGENGAGKSTFIKILSGVYQPDAGAQIVIDGEKVEKLNPMESVRRGIAVTYQDFSLFPNLSVGENIALGNSLEAKQSFLNWKNMRKIGNEALEKMNTKMDLDAQLGTLSTAKQQLVAIARALAFDAKVLILDEPTSALSSKEVENLFRIVFDIQKQGIAVLFISHKMDEVFRIADRISVLRDGCYVGTYDKREITPDEIISKMVGRTVAYERNAPANVQKEVLLEVKGLSRKGNYKDISFSLHKGEVLALTGLVGAGRTELCESIYGLGKPDEGEIILKGKAVTIANPSEAAANGIAYVPEDRREQGIVAKKSISNNISVTVLNKILGRAHLIDAKKENELAQKYVEELEIRPGDIRIFGGNLSGGNQQKVVIAKCLAVNPDILIIDEPTNGIDIGAKRKIHQLIKDLADQGMGVIMVSSELPEVMAVANRVLVMRRGRISGEFDGNTVTQEEIMHKAIL